MGTILHFLKPAALAVMVFFSLQSLGFGGGAVIFSMVPLLLGILNVFTTFAYVQSLATPAARRFLATLKQSFTSVEQAELIWKNVPPAVVIRCRNKKSLQ